MSIVTFGSVNMDLVVRTSRLPLPGETVSGEQFETVPGGKGANQAVAVARQDVPSIMIGRVGSDQFGDELCRQLTVNGVQIAGVERDLEVSTGVAAIAVAASGANHIIVVPGANGRVGRQELDQLRDRLSATRLLLLQFEVPTAATLAAAKLAHAMGVRVMLDPSPVGQFTAADLYPHVDILTPNQVEAAQLVGFAVDDLDQAAKAIAHLQQQGVPTVIIKLGERGSLCGTDQGLFHVPAFNVKTVDTVAAGDAFNGGLAVARYEGKPWREAVRWATATASLSVTQAGAQPSLPLRSAVEAFLQQQGA